MNHPGVWILGNLADDDRQHGMGIVEYANQKIQTHLDSASTVQMERRTFHHEIPFPPHSI
jgi:hypothetical protein